MRTQILKTTSKQELGEKNWELFSREHPKPHFRRGLKGRGCDAGVSGVWQAQISQFSVQHTNKNGTFTYKSFCIKVLRPKKNKPKNPPITVCPGFGLYRVNFHAADMRFGCVWAVLYHPTSLLQGKNEGFPEEMAFGPGKHGSWRVYLSLVFGPRLGERFCLYISLSLRIFVITTVAITVCFLTSLLFPVICSFINP